MKIFKNCLIAITALCWSVMTFAQGASPTGLWYNPDRPGHGISISAPTEGGYAILWYLYRLDGTSAFLVGEPCTEFPCVTPLYAPTASWLGGNFNLGDPVGSLEIPALSDNDTIRVVYDLRVFRGTGCTGTPGGLLFNECVGNITLTRATP